MSAASDVRRIQTIESTIGSLIVRLAELRERVQTLSERVEGLEKAVIYDPVPPPKSVKTNATS